MANLLVEVQCSKRECRYCHMRETVGTYTEQVPWCSLFARSLGLGKTAQDAKRCQDCLDAEVKNE